MPYVKLYPIPNVGDRIIGYHNPNGLNCGDHCSTNRVLGYVADITSDKIIVREDKYRLTPIQKDLVRFGHWILEINPDAQELPDNELTNYYE